MNVYHYNVNHLDKVLTKKIQGILTVKEENELLEMAKFREDPGPYYDSVSFLLEPAPLDILGTIFPDNHHTWTQGKNLFEHVINLEEQDFYAWVIVEGPFQLFMVDSLPWFENTYYKKMFFKGVSLGRKLAGEVGKDLNSLKKALNKIPPGTTRAAYERLPKRKDFDNIKNMYAATVPHLMLYTKSVISVKQVKSVSVGVQNTLAQESFARLRLQQNPPSLDW